MIIQRYKPTSLYRNAGITVCQLSLAVLLSACGSGQDDAAPISNTATGSVSVSAAQLAADGTTSLSLAQAAGAGFVPVSSVETSTETDLTVSSGVSEALQVSTESANSGIPAQGAASPEPIEIPEVGLPEVEVTPVEVAPVEPTPLEVVPIEVAPIEVAPVEVVPIEVAPVEPTPIEVAPVEPAPVEVAPVEVTPVDATPDLGAANGEASSETSFTATNTVGFVGEVLDDGVVKIAWVKDPTARGYNVYRDAQYVTTVFAEEYIDTDTFDESYYYEIQAFDFDENYNYVALGLTVNVTGTGRTNPDAAKPKENILDGYELVFSDEFNGTELDSSKWVTQYLWGDELIINSEEQHYVDILNKPDFGFNPFSFDGESVTINSIETPDNLVDKAFGQKYLSGVMTTYDAFKFTYGYVEARAQLPYGKGLWPAFWLLNAYYVDDKPEIDIMEFIGDDQDVVYHTYHYYDSEGELRSTHSEPSIGRDWTNGWHTYAVEWLPGTIIFYVDGIEEHRVVDAKVSQQEMYIIANTALGGWWPGSPDSSTNFPVEYKLDYVRAYQKTGPLLLDPTEGLESALPLWDDVPNASPSHLPPFEVFPQGYPERQVQ